MNSGDGAELGRGRGRLLGSSRVLCSDHCLPPGQASSWALVGARGSVQAAVQSREQDPWRKPGGAHNSSYFQKKMLFWLDMDSWQNYNDYEINEF